MPIVCEMEDSEAKPGPFVTAGALRPGCGGIPHGRTALHRAVLALVTPTQCRHQHHLKEQFHDAAPSVLLIVGVGDPLDGIGALQRLAPQ